MSKRDFLTKLIFEMMGMVKDYEIVETILSNRGLLKAAEEHYNFDGDDLPIAMMVDAAKVVKGELS